MCIHAVLEDSQDYSRVASIWPVAEVGIVEPEADIVEPEDGIVGPEAGIAEFEVDNIAEPETLVGLGDSVQPVQVLLALHPALPPPLTSAQTRRPAGSFSRTFLIEKVEETSCVGERIQIPLFIANVEVKALLARPAGPSDCEATLH